MTHRCVNTVKVVYMRPLSDRHTEAQKEISFRLEVTNAHTQSNRCLLRLMLSVTRSKHIARFSNVWGSFLSLWAMWLLWTKCKNYFKKFHRVHLQHSFIYSVTTIHFSNLRRATTSFPWAEIENTCDAAITLILYCITINCMTVLLIVYRVQRARLLPSALLAKLWTQRCVTCFGEDCLQIARICVTLILGPRFHFSPPSNWVIKKVPDGDKRVSPKDINIFRLGKAWMQRLTYLFPRD